MSALTGSAAAKVSSAFDLPPYSLSEKTVQRFKSSGVPKEYSSRSALGYGFCTARSAAAVRLLSREETKNMFPVNLTFLARDAATNGGIHMQFS